jgi:hypothetical protein
MVNKKCKYYAGGNMIRGHCTHKFNTDIRSHGTKQKKANKKRCLEEYCSLFSGK